jgi:hypothetical protein
MSQSVLKEGLLATFNTRMSFALQITWVINDPVEPYAVFSLLPILQGLSDKLKNRGIVWDIGDLIESFHRPGAYFVLNSDCGYPPDSDLMDAIHISHPNPTTIIWELDAIALAPALDPAYAGRSGFVRYVFDRDEYEADVHTMLNAVQERARTPLERAEFSEFADDLPPNVERLPAEEYEPNEGGDMLERLLKIDSKAKWLREPAD